MLRQRSTKLSQAYPKMQTILFFVVVILQQFQEKLQSWTVMATLKKGRLHRKKHHFFWTFPKLTPAPASKLGNFFTFKKGSNKEMSKSICTRCFFSLPFARPSNTAQIISYFNRVGGIWLRKFPLNHIFSVQQLNVQPFYIFSPFWSILWAFWSILWSFWSIFT